MKAIGLFRFWTAATLVAAIGWASFASAAVSAGNEEVRKQMDETFQQGNYKEAYEGFRRLALDPENHSRQLDDDLGAAVLCLENLDQADQVDELLDAAVKAHPHDWWLLRSAAQNLMNAPHQGFLVAGKFHRGNHRGGGRMVNSVERDRVRALQWMTQALPVALKDPDRAEASDFLLALANMLLGDRGYGESWRLQYPTDLKALPDYEDGWAYYHQAVGAPVDAEGNPVFHALPASFDAAATDGQRWRWCLDEAAKLNPQRRDEIRLQYADFLLNQFGVQTMAEAGWRFGREETDDSLDQRKGIFSLSTLGDDETIARLATGVKRFRLPDDANYLKIFQEVSHGREKPSRRDESMARREPGGLPPAPAVSALEQLAQVFENRRQYAKAADCWRRLLKEHPDELRARQVGWRQRLAQIVGAWGRFEPCQTQPAGRGATVDYRFRNGTRVEFTAREIHVEKLLDDVKALLASNPRRLDWQNINIADIGYRLVEEKQKKYVGRQVAQWQMKLDPRPNHCDGRVTVATPLESAGAYLVEAKMADGNTSFIVLWVADTAIVEKPLEGKTYYFVADAVSGRPVAKANCEFFGWASEYQNSPPRREIVTRRFAEFTDADGQVLLDAGGGPKRYQWLVTARTPEGRFAYLGFSGAWYGRRYDAEYSATKVYAITDRPVYRPAQKVHFKFWVRHAKYDMADASEFADRDFTVEIYNPKGDKILTENKRSDAYGGIEGGYELPADAALGVYRLVVKNLGGGQFRVEEYKKPEFEVSVDAPTAPVMLGDKITATIRAKYYFGSPVAKAKVKYTVNRTSYEKRWYPVMPWDWLFGSGYAWFGYDYDWYPGWSHWGCPRPTPFWWPHRRQPPEVVAEQEVEIGPDGTVKVEIDTAAAKAMHPDQDQSYTITAEVIDQSRRTIVGWGTVLVARQPFKVYAWVDRGYYRLGDTIAAHFSARTIAGQPVEGTGELRLLRITYKDGQPTETPVQTWTLATDANGEAHQQMTASQAGQYRLSYKLTAKTSDKPSPRDSSPESLIPNPSIEGGYVFTVAGEGFDGSQFRFNHLELVPDKREYAPGDTVKLQVNTDRAGGTVLLFVRPTSGVYLQPKIVRLDGKSVVEEIGVAQKDMPNFFVEAVTVADGRTYTETKEIVVPPEKRILNVAVQPSKEAYKPGEKAAVKLVLTDLAGKPFVGSTVVAIYDKSLEYISGGSNVPDIKAFFWKWRRGHHPNTESSLDRGSRNLVPPRTIPMNDLGVFGGTVAEEDGEAVVNGPSGGGLDGMPAMRSSANRAKAEMAVPPMAVASSSAGVASKGAMPFMVEAGGSAKPAVQPTLRTKFADTALWVGALETAADGTADVSLDMPENLTTWRIKVWGMGQGTRVGEGFADVVTRKDLILRMEAPRFFIQTDEVVLSAIVHNYLKTKKSVRIVLELQGSCLEPLIPVRYKGVDKKTALKTPEGQIVEIAPNDEARVDWRVKVLDAGEAVVRMKAITDEESDAMEQRFPCYLHGMLKTDSYCGAIRPSQESGKFTITVPEKRQPDQSRLEVRFSPTLAGAMVDALPYLVDYPYGCTEQTLNRFLPTVITQKVLLDMKVDLKEVEKKRTNLNAQELGDAAERAKQWKRPRPGVLSAGEGTKGNPAFDEDEVRRMVKAGLERLTEMQCSDGGWGWFSGWGEYSSPHTTAQVVHGLLLARRNDVALVPGVLERGVEWLKRHQDEQVRVLKNADMKDKPDDLQWKPHADDTDALVYMVLVEAGEKNADMLDLLYRDRTHLSVYSLAMFGIALEEQGEKDKLAMVMRNIGQYVEQDDENQTAWLHMPPDCWWCWYGSEYEAEACYLKLLARTDPKGELAPRLVKYLLNNRKNATYWNSTRDTALCVEAFAEFLRQSGEDKPEMTVAVYFDGKLRKTVAISPQNLFTFDNAFVLEGRSLEAGPHTVELKRKGRGPVYYNGYATNFTLEDFITKAGLEVKVDRKYYKLVKADRTQKAAGSRGQVLDEKIEKYERQELPNFAELKSGDLVEIELTIDSKNDYEYLVFEDMKPSGFEPIEVRSGYTGNELGAYVEFRDSRVVFFVRELARGRHSVSYRMRAEVPGKLSALPTRASAMYAPELKGNSDELKLRVEDVVEEVGNHQGQ